MTRQLLYLPGVPKSVDVSGSYYKDVTTWEVQYTAEVPTCGGRQQMWQ
jgi:hypothetical protein